MSHANYGIRAWTQYGEGENINENVESLKGNVCDASSREAKVTRVIEVGFTDFYAVKLLKMSCTWYLRQIDIRIRDESKENVQRHKSNSNARYKLLNLDITQTKIIIYTILNLKQIIHVMNFKSWYII